MPLDMLIVPSRINDERGSPRWRALEQRLFLLSQRRMFQEARTWRQPAQMQLPLVAQKSDATVRVR